MSASCDPSNTKVFAQCWIVPKTELVGTTRTNCATDTPDRLTRLKSILTSSTSDGGRKTLLNWPVCIVLSTLNSLNVLMTHAVKSTCVVSEVGLDAFIVLFEKE